MITINENYLKLQASYLFSDIAKRVAAFEKNNPDRDVIKLGIGDVTKGLMPASIKAFHEAVDEMANDATFKGYGPEQGYEFLREAIAVNDFKSRGADISADEVFVSDGAKCDSGNIQEIFSQDIKIAIPDPVYPVYLDTNVMAGRTGIFADGRYQGLVYLDSTRENNFVPALPEEPVDLIYLCFPNNPTGSTISKQELKTWVDYARDNKALILFDAAYEAFISDDSLPKSIFEIEGAKEVAIEFRSFSKSAGFTGTRCAYTVVPKECAAYDSKGNKHLLHALWNRRHCTKFNGVSYPVQRAAAAVYTEQGKAESKALIDYYMVNARAVCKTMDELGYSYVGGTNSPYIWVDGKTDSWEFFDMLLNKAGVVCTPGAGFGKCGNGYIRISAFNSHDKVKQAMERIKASLA
ncbi:LL-diaminopimelate aminotransferase [Desulforhopalus singaporensis]|uniref:LL-diaminopimelate aminotransferase n=1 Tax=Desulforhopalus singaporensis TaxID=91360 RepID=A0A1H0QJS6_9BACT|nr:LL-diaminopimelate aminotransferase [Desulforhopalus singaporensis]SDP17552.1 LL-diaminopimelate aminotransferase apoenzyme [Desulforhopalus singaporensis]